MHLLPKMNEGIGILFIYQPLLLLYSSLYLLIEHSDLIVENIMLLFYFCDISSLSAGNNYCICFHMCTH